MAINQFLDELRRFQHRVFPRYRDRYQALVAEGQHPRTLFIGCSDSRIVPTLLTDSGPGDLFVVRNIGNIVPPHDPSTGLHETSAAVEYAVGILGVSDIVVCGHSHCGAMRALYEPVGDEYPHTRSWVALAGEAKLDGELSEATLRRTEQRSVVLQIERLLQYPLVRERVERGALAVHGWYYVIEDGRVEVLDWERGEFISPDEAAQNGGEGQVSEDATR